MRVYLDHAATTPLREEVAAAMAETSGNFGNPSSIHAEGKRARAALEGAREALRDALGASGFDLLFTSGGTEAINAAILGVVRTALDEIERDSVHVVWSAVEHAATLATADVLRSFGVEITVVPALPTGAVDPDSVRGAIRPATRLVSVMSVNNETGVLLDTEAIGNIVQRHGAAFHVDAVQALGKVPIDLARWPVDLVSLSAHKIGGPKGAGALLVRRGVGCAPHLLGGKQEGGRRAGTENVAGAIGFARAVEVAEAERVRVTPERRARRDRLRELVEGGVEGTVVHAPRAAAAEVGTVLNVSFPRVTGEALVRRLDSVGVAASTASACSVGAGRPSHVLEAMGVASALVRGAVRFSIGPGTSAGDIEFAGERIVAAANELALLAPADAP